MVWREHYQTRREAQAAALHARLAQLYEERDALPSQERDAVTAQIAEVGRAIAELTTPASAAAPLASCG